MHCRRLVLLALMLGVVASTAAVPAAGSVGGTLTDLGTPMRAVNVRYTAAGAAPSGGGLLYAVSDGNPPSLNVVDAASGDLKLQWDGPGPEFVGGAGATAPDGRYYFTLRSGSRTIVYRYDPVTNEVVEELRACSSGCAIDQPILRGLTIGSDGVLYFGSYPDAKVYSYRPSDGALHDFGSVTDAGDYAWGITLVDRSLYVGTGTGKGELRRVDLDSGAVSDVALPDGANTTVISDLSAVGDYVLVPVGGDDGLGIYNTATEAWECEDAAPGPTPSPTDSLSEPTDDGRVFFRAGDEFYAFDATTCTTTAMGVQGTDLELDDLRGLMAVRSGNGDEAGYSVAAFRSDGSSFVWDGDGAPTEHPNKITGAPVTAHSLGVGPDGDVYVGAYLSPGVMARVDPATGETEMINGPGQSDTIATVNGRIVVGSYGGGVVHSGVTAQPWDWGTNPREIYRGTADRQDRVFDIIDAGDVGAAGTVSEYGHLGGALTLFDPVTGERTVERNIVHDQSVVALEARRGMIYGGTSIHNGLSTEPTATEGTLFGYDIMSGERQFLQVPVPGDETVSTLEFGRRNFELWGMTYENNLFNFDTRSQEVIDVIPVDLPSLGAQWGRVPELRFRHQDGLFYGVAGETLFSFDPGSKAVKVLDDTRPWKTLTMTDEGAIFLIDDTNVYEFVVDGDS